MLYETKHPALLPHDHEISRLITGSPSMWTPRGGNNSSQNENKVLDLASSLAGEDSQILVYHLQRNGAKDRKVDYVRLTSSQNSTR